MPSNTGDTALENLTKILVANALDMAVSSSWEGHSGLNRAKMAYLIAFRWLPGGAYGFRCHRLEVRLIVSWRVATTPARHLPHGRDLNSVVQHDQKLAAISLRYGWPRGQQSGNARQTIIVVLPSEGETFSRCLPLTTS